MTGTHGFTSKSLVCEMRFVFEKETQDEYNHHFIRFEGYLIYSCTKYMPQKLLIKILLVLIPPRLSKTNIKRNILQLRYE